MPFRRNGNAVSLCLITAASSNHWSIPKGNIERGSSPEDTALEEAWEEAGLRGRIVGDPLGSFEYKKFGSLRTVAVFVMEVESAAEHWDEDDVRRRRWVAPAEALKLLDGHPARPLVEEACRRLTG